MGQSLSRLFPWFSGKNKKEEQAKPASGETTSGGEQSTPWVVVAVNLSPAEAAIIKGRLESHDLPTLIQQEAMGVMLGLTVGPMGSARVLVPEPLGERALSILAETFEASEESEKDENREEE